MDYVYDRARLIRDLITADEARELYREAEELDGSELTGDLEHGFSFWGVVLREGAKLVRLVRCDVTPISTTDHRMPTGAPRPAGVVALTGESHCDDDQ